MLERKRRVWDSVLNAWANAVLQVRPVNAAGQGSMWAHMDSAGKARGNESGASSCATGWAALSLRLLYPQDW